MNNELKKFLIMFLSILFLETSCQNQKKIYMMVYNDQQKELLTNFILYKKYDTKTGENNNYLIFDNINENILMEIIEVLYLKIGIIENNISNEKTTRTYEGGPYIRQYLKITVENGIEIINDAENSERLVYDPTHPDAIKTGDNAGYVRFPNIDITTEYVELSETIILYNSIINYIENNYKNIIVGKLNIKSLDKIEHELKIERMLQLMLKYVVLEK
jgi:flagellar basal body rod protein FlgC